MQLTEIHPDLRYDGPETVTLVTNRAPNAHEIKSLWTEFCLTAVDSARGKMMNGMPKVKKPSDEAVEQRVREVVRSLNDLNDIVFRKDGLKHFLERPRKDIPREGMDVEFTLAGLDLHNPQNRPLFNAGCTPVLGLCKDSSNLTIPEDSKKWRILKRALSQALVTQFVQLREEATQDGSSFARSRGPSGGPLPENIRAVNEANRRAFLGKPNVSMVKNMLWTLHEGAAKRIAHDSVKPLLIENPNIPFDEIPELVQSIFENCLFRYDPNHPGRPDFESYLLSSISPDESSKSGLASSLKQRANQLKTKGVSFHGMADDRGKAFGPAHFVAAPDNGGVRAKQGKFFQEVLRGLPDDDSELLSARYGSESPFPFKPLARGHGVSESGIRRRLESLERRIKSEYGADAATGKSIPTEPQNDHIVNDGAAADAPIAPADAPITEARLTFHQLLQQHVRLEQISFVARALQCAQFVMTPTDIETEALQSLPTATRLVEGMRDGTHQPSQGMALALARVLEAARMIDEDVASRIRVAGAHPTHLRVPNGAARQP